MSDTKELKSLSYSSLKLLESCSYKFYARYILNLPEKTNEGALMGTICHNIFELLLNPKHKQKYNTVLSKGTITSVKSIEKLIKKYCKNLKLEPKIELLLKIDQMLLVGLKSDFFVEGGELLSPEYKFDITNESPRYRIKGFIDKLHNMGDSLLIDDYKSSKKKFENEEIHSNMQSLMYILASKKLWPEKKAKVRFIFLQYPEDVFLYSEYDDNILKGFEHFLEYSQNRIENFTEKDAKSDYAYDKGLPKDGSFSGALLCGFAKVKGELKKDGTPKYHCPYRFAYDYYVVLEGEKIIKSYFEDEKNLIKLKEGQKLEKRHFNGCPRFN